MARVWHDEDTTYLRSIEAERIEITAPDITYFRLRRGASVDPLYREPNPFRHEDGVETVGHLKLVPFDNRTDTAEETGLKHQYDAELAISRNEWEDKFGTAVVPKIGDVITVWTTTGPWSFDVIKADKAGIVVDSGEWVDWKFNLKRNSTFVPERKVDGQC